MHESEVGMAKVTLGNSTVEYVQFQRHNALQIQFTQWLVDHLARACRDYFRWCCHGETHNRVGQSFAGRWCHNRKKLETSTPDLRQHDFENYNVVSMRFTVPMETCDCKCINTRTWLKVRWPWYLYMCISGVSVADHLAIMPPGYCHVFTRLTVSTWPWCLI